jgi:succinylarginine dihydrolase
VTVAALREYNFDGLVGPTHNYAGLAAGNLASQAHKGLLANPRQAALQGLNKMRRVAALGVGQALLPPHERPAVGALRRLGFAGSDEEVLRQVASTDEQLLRLCSSASAMWTANAATVSPSVDTEDARLHLTPANLSSMFHRALEVDTTTRVLRLIFDDPELFCVHDALLAGSHFADEGAANHTRLVTSLGALELFGWGRTAFGNAATPSHHPARQTLEASSAVARRHRLKPGVSVLWQQSPLGIDAGAFHSDVLVVGNANLLLVHEHAFAEQPQLLQLLKRRLGDELQLIVAGEKELAVRDAVAAYPFNSQLISKPNSMMAIVAPIETEQCAAAREFLERAKAESSLVDEIVYMDVNASMNNGGGPACLRLRVAMTDAERAAIQPRVFWDEALHAALEAWINQHYRDRLSLEDLSDPQLLDETRRALDELTQLLQLGAIYEFQQAPGAIPCT